MASLTLLTVSINKNHSQYNFSRKVIPKISASWHVQNRHTRYGISGVITRHDENTHASSRKGQCASYSGFSLHRTNTSRTNRMESALVFP